MTLRTSACSRSAEISNWRAFAITGNSSSCARTDARTRPEISANSSDDGTVIAGAGASIEASRRLIASNSVSSPRLGYFPGPISGQIMTGSAIPHTTRTLC